MSKSVFENFLENILRITKPEQAGVCKIPVIMCRALVFLQHASLPVTGRHNIQEDVETIFEIIRNSIRKVYKKLKQTLSDMSKHFPVVLIVNDIQLSLIFF